MSQLQKALITAKLVVEADDLRSAEQFVDHLARKPHITVIKRSEPQLPTGNDDRVSIHLTVERRACWGNWVTDIRRDVQHSARRSGSTASCTMIEVVRAVVATRTQAEADAAHLQAKAGNGTTRYTFHTAPIEPAATAEEASEPDLIDDEPDPGDTRPNERSRGPEEREFGEVDMLAAAQDYEAELMEARGEGEDPEAVDRWQEVTGPIDPDDLSP